MGYRILGMSHPLESVLYSLNKKIDILEQKVVGKKLGVGYNDSGEEVSGEKLGFLTDEQENEMEEIETKYYLENGLSADLLKYFEDRFSAKYGFRYHSIEETNHREKCSIAAILSFIDDEKAKYVVAYLVEEYVKYCKEHDY